MPLTALALLVLDIVTTMVWQAFGVPDLGDTGLVITSHRCLLIVAAAATMWHHPRTAVLASVAVAALVFTVGPSGEELWLLIIIAVTAAIRANRWQLGLVLLALVGYAVGFGFLVEQQYPGEGPGMRAGLLAIIGASLSVGLVARWLLRTRDRRRSRVRQLELEQAEIRAAERARLADELQLVVTQGLAGITDELDHVSSRRGDLAGLRSGLAQIGLRSSALLEQLRVLLDVLRSDPHPGPTASPVPPPASDPRRVADLLTARHVRIAATAVLVLVAVRAAAGDLGAPAAEVWVQVGGLLAYALAVWRPELGVGCAVLVVAAAAGLGSSSDWDVLATSLVCLVAAVRWRPLPFWGALVGVAGYAGFVGFSEVDPVDHVLLLCLLAFPAVAGGLAARHLLTARRQSLRQLTDLADERRRMESEERGSVARELHDVVAHSLSVISMLVMATSLSSDRGRLVDTLDQVRRSVESARQELSTLVHALRGPDGDGSPVAPLVSPLATASSLAHRLAERGHAPVLDLDAGADDLDPTTQRTLSRILTEAATNILRYAPAGSPCRIGLQVEQTGVMLRVVSPLVSGPTGSGRRSELSLGWGLRGVRERVELTHGTFHAGAEHGQWILTAILPAVVPAPPPIAGVAEPNVGAALPAV